MMFLSAKMLWGKMAGHTAAFLTLVCPATTVYLIDHRHSYSHLGALLLLGPALFTALRLLREANAPSPPTVRLYAMSGALWGLCYLCRSELALFFAVHFLLLLFLLIRRKQSLPRLVAYLAAFLVIFVPYNTSMDPSRDWQPEWGDLPVTVQRCFSYKILQRHEQGFSEDIWRDFPYD